MNFKKTYYAQLNDDNVCIGVSQLSGDVDGNVVLLDHYDVSIINKKYNNGVWEDFYTEIVENINDGNCLIEPYGESLETIIINNQSAVMLAIAEQYEEQQINNTTLIEAQATIYEKLLDINKKLEVANNE